MTPSARQIPNWLEVAARSHPDKPALSFAGQELDVCRSARIGRRRGRGVIRRPSQVRAASASCPPIDRGSCSRFTPQRAWRSVRPAELAAESEELVRSCGCRHHRWSSTRNERRRSRLLRLAGHDRADRGAGTLAPPGGSPDAVPGSISSGKRRSSTPRGPAGGRRVLASPMATSGSAQSPPPSISDITGRCLAGGHALFHVGGLAILFRGAIGGVPVIPTSAFSRKCASRHQRGVTLLSVVPTMLQHCSKRAATARGRRACAAFCWEAARRRRGSSRSAFVVAFRSRRRTD